MKNAQYGRLPSFQEISEALSPIEAVGISYESMKIHITDAGKITVGIPKELVIADRKEQIRLATSPYDRTAEGHPTIDLLSYAGRIANCGEKHQIEDKNNPGSSVEISARTVVDFLSAVEDKQVVLYPPPTSHEQRRLNEAKQNIINLGISRLSQ